MFTKDELQMYVAREAEQIETVKRVTAQRMKQMEADANNAIGQCQGRIEIYHTLLRELNGPVPEPEQVAASVS